MMTVHPGHSTRGINSSKRASSGCQAAWRWHTSAMGWKLGIFVEHSHHSRPVPIRSSGFYHDVMRLTTQYH